MKISIFGLGYVGAVVTACFARDGHDVIGVDTDDYKVSLINEGRSPIIEDGLEDMLLDGVKKGRIRACTDSLQAVRNTEMSLICVGTPSKSTGDLDLGYVRRVSEDIGCALKEKQYYHIVVTRSTMLPGSMEGTVIPTLERFSGKKACCDFGVAINPEFLREGSAIKDFYQPPKTVIGAQQPKDADTVALLYEKLEAPLIKTSIKTAEMVKYTDNVFHALKVTFGNEIGAICRSMGIDSAEVMGIFCQDRKLNLSPAYFRPGFAYGGSCLPKDLRALNRLAHVNDIEVPLISSIGISNELQIRRAMDAIISKGTRRIGVMGFAFKGGTDDLRESPIVSLIELLIGKGFDLKIYDRHVSLSRLIGANRRFIEHRIPHIARLMVDNIAELIEHAEIVVVGNQNPEFAGALAQLTTNQHVIDLRPAGDSIQTPAKYTRLT